MFIHQQQSSPIFYNSCMQPVKTVCLESLSLISKWTGMYTVTANWPSQSRLSYPLYLQGSFLTKEALLANLVVLDMPLCLVLWCHSKLGLS